MKMDEVDQKQLGEGDTVPSVTFKTRVRDDSIEGDNPYTWKDMTTDDYFKGKKVIVFSLPGAFTPTCSTYQLPGFEKMHEDFTQMGIDDVYCLSVNDSFVMNKWANSQNLQYVKVIPDGNGEFTEKMGMTCPFRNRGFGPRSWRYAMIVDDGIIEKMFVEPNRVDDSEDDPYGESSPENILEYLK